MSKSETFSYTNSYTNSCDYIYGSFPNKSFADVWNEDEKFVTDYRNSGLNVEDIPDDSLYKLFYLLYARYGNSIIVNNDENQFKYRVYSTIYMYGPTWYRRVEVQTELRKMTMDELKSGGKAIYNQAAADGTAPSTATLYELPAINGQNVTNYVKSDLEGYNLLLNLLKTDVTKEFIDRFENLFMKLASSPNARYYVTEV